MPEKYYSRPRDRSLQAFKDWIRGMVIRLVGESRDTMSEEEWIDGWKRFWEKVDSAAGPKKSNEE